MVAARRLFANRGVEAVTVREIVAAAGAKNGGSLNYYFGSKDGLVIELINEFFRENTDLLLDHFSQFERQGGPSSVREVVAAIVDCYQPVNDPSPTAARFLSNLLSTRRRFVREFMERVHFSVYERMMNYVQELRPDIPSSVLRQRWVLFAWYMVSALGAHESYLAGGRRTKIWTEFDPLTNIIDTAAALLEAPVHENKMQKKGDV